MASGAPATQRSERTRAELLAAARQVFRNKGYQSTTVAQIASGAGRAHGTFYLYFPNKQAAFAALIDEIDEEMWAASRALWRSDDVPASIWITIRRFIDDFGRTRHLWAMLDQMAATEPEFAELRKHWRDGFIQRVRRGFKLGSQDGLVGLNSAVLADLLASTIEEACRSMFLEGRPRDPDEMARNIALIWVATLGYDAGSLTPTRVGLDVAAQTAAPG